MVGNNYKFSYILCYTVNIMQIFVNGCSSDMGRRTSSARTGNVSSKHITFPKFTYALYTATHDAMTPIAHRMCWFGDTDNSWQSHLQIYLYEKPNPRTIYCVNAFECINSTWLQKATAFMCNLHKVKEAIIHRTTQKKMHASIAHTIYIINTLGCDRA